MKIFASWGVRRWTAFSTILALALALVLGGVVMRTVEDRRVDMERGRANLIAKIQAGRIAHIVDSELVLADTLRVLVEEGDGAIEQFDSLMPKIAASPALRNVALAPGGVIRQIYPPEGNEEAVGHDILNDPDRALETALAVESRQFTLTGPYELRQGGVGLVGRMPVYLRNEGGESYFWGLTCVTINVNTSLRMAELDRLTTQGYAYELWRSVPDTGEKQVIARSGAPLPADPEEWDVTLPNSTWTLSLAPEEGWQGAAVRGFEVVVVLLFALLFALLVRAITALAFSHWDLQITLRRQVDNYKLLNGLNKDLRLFHRDANNHLLSLSSFLERGETEEAKGYIQSLVDAPSGAPTIFHTENDIFDALLAYKLAEARQKGIVTKADILLPHKLRIENQDWGTLFGNALDNAIEACVHAPGEDPCLWVSVRCVGTALHILITNTSAPPRVRADRAYPTGKVDGLEHGLGLRQIRSVVNKYHGVMEAGWENGVFTLAILLAEM